MSFELRNNKELKTQNYSLLTKAFTATGRSNREAIFDLRSQGVVIQVLTNQHQLVLGFAFPVIIIQREAFAAEVEDMTFGAFAEPENTLSAKDISRKLIVEEELEFANIKGLVAGEGDGGKAIIL